MARGEWEIKAVRPEDLPEICRLEKEAGLNFWQEDSYSDYLAGAEHLFLAAVTPSHGRLGAFCLATLLPPEMEIMKLAVAPESQGTGLGRELLQAVMTAAVERGCRSCFLEVREGNLRARGFYRRLGFRVTGRRPDYYQSPIEDALVLCYNLTTTNS